MSKKNNSGLKIQMNKMSPNVILDLSFLCFSLTSTHLALVVAIANEEVIVRYYYRL